MALRAITAFLGALTAVALVLVVIAVVQARLASSADIDLDGEWRLAHRIEKGPYKAWTFAYRVRLTEQPGGFTGRGETIAVNGRAPEPHERTTLDIVRGVIDEGSLIAWFFERNGERAGRGALKWRIVDDDRLVGHYATTFSSGASVALRDAALDAVAAVR